MMDPVASDIPDHSPKVTANFSSFRELLAAKATMSGEAFQRARMMHEESGEKMELVVTRLGLMSEDALIDLVASETALARVSKSDWPETAIGAEKLSALFLRENRIIPIALAEDAVTVAVFDPFETFMSQSLAFVFGRPVRLKLARASDIEGAIDRLYGAAGPADDGPDDYVDEDDVERLKDLVSDAPVIRAVNRLIAQASDARASDIHIEPTDDRLVVRYRIDGVLEVRDALPAAMRAPLVSRIKVMAGLNIAERRLPQDGRLRIAVRGNEIDLRVATAPSIHGESVVMRILDRSKLALDFSSLGFDAELIAQLRAAIAKPYGIVLVTGPTGSGKTTTLYAALAELNSDARKLLTVEDPIEYRLPGVVQTQVNPTIGLTFGSALRSFLRLDPDVMMVGEIRDVETAQIAVQAALTGHMILSTLHTNSAAGAVTRLIDMEVEPFLLSSVLSGILAQRLVRKLCPECKKPYTASKELLADLEISDDGPVTFYQAVGCADCNNTGFSGRTSVLEFLKVDDSIARLILRRADAREIAQAGMAAKMRTLRDDGLAKARAGLTTVEEAVRVAAGE